MLSITGNISQMISAAGAICFGIASLWIAHSAQQLQHRQIIDNALGRTSQLLTRYIEADSKTFKYGFKCIGHVLGLAQQLENFDERIKDPEDAMFFSAAVADRALVAPANLSRYDGCVSGIEESGDKHAEIINRFQFPLNELSLVLLEWQTLPEEARDLITREITHDACGYPIEPLSDESKKHPFLNQMLNDDYKNLANFVLTKCAK
jgi:hypothetical protein